MPTKIKPHFRSGGFYGYPELHTTQEYGFSEYISYSTSRKVNGKFTAFLPCDHKKLTKPGSIYVHSGGGGVVYNWAHPEAMPWDQLVAYGLSQAHLGLDFQENNNFEIIPFLMDWDSTMAMFSKKFIRELSYGAVTWGVMPFMSDLRSLAASLEDIHNGLLKSYEKILGKRITRRFTWNMETEIPYHKLSANGHTTVFGVVEGNNFLPQSPKELVEVLLDEIGLHLDLKTAWDVIPLSFVVDYFLPIGDMLEKLSPRGWFNPSFTLTGGYSVKYTLVDQFYSPNPNEFGDSSTWTHYVRAPGSLTLGSRPPVEPKFQSPSFRELFNSLYLGNQMRKR